jgi:hypothetical protein
VDTGLGNFTPISEQRTMEIKTMSPELSRIFQKGEILYIRGSRFRIERIKARSLRLLLLADDE